MWSGMVECGFLKKYVINIGIRQEDRVSCRNVFHTRHDSKQILKIMRQILNLPIIRKKSLLYGAGKSAIKFVNILSQNYNFETIIKKKFIRNRLK